MKNKLLIVPGYLVGIGSLCIITFRTLLAFLSENKAVTIYVNRYGEQYVDIALLIFIWIICLVGLIYLYIVMKEERITKILENNIRGKKIMDRDGSYLGILRNSLIDGETGLVLGVLVEPTNEIDLRLYRLDAEGNLGVPLDTIKVVEDAVIVGE